MPSGAPKAPDYKGAAEQQNASSMAMVDRQTEQNRLNQTNAFGTTSTFGPDGTQQTQFGGALGQYAQGLQGQLDGNWKPGAITDGSAARDQAINSAYQQAASRLDPRFQQDEATQRNQLYAQGLREGDAAFDNQMSNFGRQKNDAYTSAMASAVAQGQSAGDSVFRNNLAAHQQGITDHNLPMQQLAALNQFTGQQGYNTAGQAQATQYLNAAQMQGDYAMQQAQMNNSLMGGAMGGAFALGGAALPFALGPAGGAAAMAARK